VPVQLAFISNRFPESMSSRIAAGRERAAAAKRFVALVAAGGFVSVLVLARATHPGAAAASGSAGLSPPQALVSQVQAGSSLAPGAIAPASSAPAVSTSTS
jgi:hypothetical protein